MNKNSHRPHGRHRPQRGFGTVEYILITGILVGALLTPFSIKGDSAQNILQRLIGAIKSQHAGYLYAASLPVRPHGPGWAGEGTNDSRPGDIFGGSGSGGADTRDGAPFPSSGGGSSGDAYDLPDYDDLGAGSGGSGDEPGNDSNSGGTDNAATEPGDPAGGGDGSANNGDDSAGDSDGDSGFDIDWGWLAALGAQAYCLLTPPLETAWTADDMVAYQAAKDAYTTDGAGFAEAEIFYDPENAYAESGFSASLTKADGQWILAFRGTEPVDTGDWWNNLTQALVGNSSQYDQAIALARRVERELEGEILYVGHSLGGGMATAAAYATDARAITFNAAGLHPVYRDGDPGGIRAHYVVGELLHSLQLVPGIPDAMGQHIAHSASCARGPFPYGPLQRHFKDAFEGSLARWQASQESSVTAPTGTRPAEPSMPQEAPGSAVDYDLRTFVPPAQRNTNQNIQVSP